MYITPPSICTTRNRGGSSPLTSRHKPPQLSSEEEVRSFSVTSLVVIRVFKNNVACAGPRPSLSFSPSANTPRRFLSSSSCFSSSCFRSSFGFGSCFRSSFGRALFLPLRSRAMQHRNGAQLQQLMVVQVQPIVPKEPRPSVRGYRHLRLAQGVPDSTLDWSNFERLHRRRTREVDHRQSPLSFFVR